MLLEMSFLRNEMKRLESYQGEVLQLGEGGQQTRFMGETELSVDSEISIFFRQIDLVS